MVQFRLDDVMERYDVLVPFTLAGENSQITVASISKDKEPQITLHRELSVKLLHSILLAWDDYSYGLSLSKDRELEEERG